MVRPCGTTKKSELLYTGKLSHNGQAMWKTAALPSSPAVTRALAVTAIDCAAPARKVFYI